MRKKTFSGIGILLLVVLLSTVVSRNGFALGNTIYVPDQYTTIQPAIDAAVNGDTVVVRDGTYLLTAALDFNGKAITVRSENGSAKCFLDGQNTTRVVYFHSGETSTSVLSGFTIRNGRATQGAGIFCSGSSPTISHCNISSNTAFQSFDHSYGGGISIFSSSPIISDCVINGNRSEATSSSYAYAYGAGIHINGGSPTILKSTINGNMATTNTRGAFGGGIFSIGSTPSIIDSTISNNSSSSAVDAQGGGIFFSTSTPSLVNCIINGNSAKTGAGIYFDQSSAFSTLTNSTIVRNTASANGGGLYCANTSPKIVNSILWEDSPDEVYKDATSSPTISYSDVLGGYSGTGNIDASPLFVDIALPNLHLRANSPCINVGNNAAPALPNLDKDGRNRLSNLVVDMGAYEYQAAQLTVFRPGNGNWYNLLSSSPVVYDITQWGLSTDVLVPGDYDNDGVRDYAVWRPGEGIWYVLPSSDPEAYLSRQWGGPTDKPLPGDYDGDGIPDYAVWRPETGTWYIQLSGSPGSYTSTQWGLATDSPVPADYDGDGSTDIAVWRPSTGSWYYLPSGGQQSYVIVQWGTSTDKPVPGDYDGDHKVDIAVLRPSSGMWYVLPSKSPEFFTNTKWGIASDKPVPLDFDGDGIVDIAVWRPSTGIWYILPSAAPGTYISVQWGGSTDWPISPIAPILAAMP